MRWYEGRVDSYCEIIQSFLSTRINRWRTETTPRHREREREREATGSACLQWYFFGLDRLVWFSGIERWGIAFLAFRALALRFLIFRLRSSKKCGKEGRCVVGYSFSITCFVLWHILLYTDMKTIAKLSHKTSKVYLIIRGFETDYNVAELRFFSDFWLPWGCFFFLVCWSRCGI